MRHGGGTDDCKILIECYFRISGVDSSRLDQKNWSYFWV